MSVEHQQLVGERDQHRDANAALPHVAVLLSAFNGASFITQQLDSIFAQHSVAVDLFLRDDGSADATVELVQAHPQAARIKLLGGDNKGVTGSFFALISAVPSTYTYYAFADQDDVWDADKLICAINAMATETRQADLYCSALRLVDARLSPIRDHIVRKPRIELACALWQNIATGHTMVFSRALAELAKQHQPASAIMHDWWLYLLAIASKKTIIYDPQPHAAYRQHASNVLGVVNRSRMFLQYIDELRQGTIIARTIVQARALYSALGESLDPGDAALVSCFYNPRSTLRSRARYLTAHKPRATTRTRTLLLAFTYLLPHRQLKS